MNGESLLGARHKHAVGVIKSLRDRALFLICDGYDDTNVLPTKVNRGHEQQRQGDHDVVVASALGQADVPRVHGRALSLDSGSRGRGTELRGHERLDEGRGLVVGDHGVGVSRGRGRVMSSESGSQGQGLVFQGHELVAGTVADGDAPVVQGHDVLLDSGSQGQGQGLVFEGHELVASTVADMDVPVVQRHDVSLDSGSQGQGQGLLFEGCKNDASGVSEPRADEVRRDRARQRRLAR